MCGDGLQIRLLGDLELLRGGRPVGLPPSRKTRALLAYLVATARPHLRERLCDLLWEGPSDPRAALRWSVTKLRPLLDAGQCSRLAADRERIAFVSHGADIDIARLAPLMSGGVAAATAETLRQAAALFALLER